MKTVRVLILTLSLALLLGGCAAGGGTADSSAPAEVPTESQPVTDAPEAPSPLQIWLGHQPLWLSAQLMTTVTLRHKISKIHQIIRRCLKIIIQRALPSKEG